MERHNHRDNFFSILRYHIPVRKKSRSQDGSRGEAPRRNLHPDTWSPRKFATNIRTICKLCLQVSLGCFLKGNHAWWSERGLSFSWRREKTLESLNSSRSFFCLNLSKRQRERYYFYYQLWEIFNNWSGNNRISAKFTSMLVHFAGYLWFLLEFSRGCCCSNEIRKGISIDLFFNLILNNYPNEDNYYKLLRFLDSSCKIK